jgi:hypothetical protein
MTNLCNEFKRSLRALVWVLISHCKQLWRHDGRHKEPQEQESGDGHIWDVLETAGFMTCHNTMRVKSVSHG